MPTVDEEILGLKTRYRRENNLDLIRAVVGTADGTVVDSTAPGFIWVRLQTSNGLSAPRRVLGPSGKAMSLQAGSAVNLEYDKMGQLRVAEPDNLTVLAGGGNPIASVVQPTTASTPRMTQGSLETLRVIPSAPASLIVAVKAWNPIVSGTQYQFTGATVNLTSYVPSSGNMRYAVIFVKSDYVTTEVFASTARSTADVPLDNADIQECLAAASAGSTPVWAIKLVGGQTTITQDNIDVDGVDLRQMVNTAQGSTAVTDATTSATGVVLIDQPAVPAHPVALTLAALGVAGLLGLLGYDGMQPTQLLPTPSLYATGQVAESSRWLRSGSNPLFGGANSSAAQEPNVLIENGIFKMWYTSGWAAPQLNYATSTDGTTWTQYGSNPVLGNGGSGYAGTFVAHTGLVKLDNTYYFFFVDGAPGNWMRSTSTDGITWTTPVQLIAYNAYAWANGWANSNVWREGYTWYALVEYLKTSGSPLLWQTALFTSTDGLAWTNVSSTLTSLIPSGGGAVSGAYMMPTPKRNGLYHLWYHATAVNDVVPTDLYHATSKDLLSWTITNSGNPILTHTGSAPEVDQVADPSIVEYNNKTYLYYAGADNGTNTSKICVATYDGTLAELLDGTAIPKIDIKEASAPSSPASGFQSVFIDSADHHLKRKNSSGTVTDIEGSTSPLTTKGDLYGYSTTNARIPIGADGQVLTADSTQPLGLKWTAASGGGGGSTITKTTKSFYQRTVLYDNTLGSAGTWDVSSIDQTYDHLEIILHGRATANAGGEPSVLVAFNNDSTNNNYLFLQIYGGNSSGGGLINNYRGVSTVTDAAAAANLFADSIISIPNYTASEYKNAYGTIVSPQSTTVAHDYVRSVTWRNTSAINRIALTVENATNTFVAGSRLQIIGIKAETVVTDVSGAGTVQMTDSSNTTVASTAAETTLVSGVVGTQTFAANALSALGRQLRISAWGYVSDTGTPTIQLKFKLGSTVVLDSGAVTLGSGISNKLWRFEGVVVTQVTGASGKVFAQGQFYQNGVTTDIVNTAQTSIDLTASLLADLTATWGTSSASNTITCSNLLLEVLN